MTAVTKRLDHSQYNQGTSDNKHSIPSHPVVTMLLADVKCLR
jgi:hypothetical protein